MVSCTEPSVRIAEVDGALVHAAAIQPFGLLIAAARPGIGVDALSVPVLRDLVRRHRVVVVRGFTHPRTPEELVAFAERWGPVQDGPTGHVLDILEHPGVPDHVLGSGHVPLHWDGMFSRLVPELSILACLAAPGPGAGGQTVYCDTEAVWRAASAPARALWARATLRYRIRTLTHAGGTVAVPLVSRHPVTGTPVVRFHEHGPVRAPRCAIEVAGVAARDQALLLGSVLAAVHDPRHTYEHEWRVGDLVIADNYALLHGRRGFPRRARRHLRRVSVLGEPAFDSLGWQHLRPVLDHDCGLAARRGENASS